MGTGDQDNFALSQAALAVRPQAGLGQILKGKACSWYEKWVENTSEDSPYWNSGFWREMQDSVKDIKIPIFLHGGWFDVFLRPQISSWRSLPAAVRSKSRFMIGPWHHAGVAGGALEYPGENRVGFMQIKSALEWFDHHLKGKPYPQALGVIEAYSIRDNQWKVWQDDFSADRMQTFYFACKDTSSGVLSSQSPAAAGTASYSYDPANPVSSVAGTLLGNYRDPFGQPECSTIMMAIGERTDVLSFVSDPLEQDLHVTGAMAAHLFVSSSVPATAFTVTVMEMRPDGTSVNIRDDITDIRWTDEKSMKPYKAKSIVELTLHLLDVSWMLGEGSRLRVDISSSNFPAYHVNSNTEEPWSQAIKQVKAVQTIYCGGDYPSRIELPVK